MPTPGSVNVITGPRSVHVQVPSGLYVPTVEEAGQGPPTV